MFPPCCERDPFLGQVVRTAQDLSASGLGLGSVLEAAGALWQGSRLPGSADAFIKKATLVGSSVPAPKSPLESWEVGAMGAPPEPQLFAAQGAVVEESEGTHIGQR